MPVVNCHITGCTFATPDVDNAVAAVMLSHHLTSEHPAPLPRKAPAIPPPKTAGNIYEDQWDCFVREWVAFKESNRIADDKLPLYLLGCCSPELKSNVERANPTIATQPEADVLAVIKRHAVISMAASVLRTELLAMKQDHGENVLTFASRALGKARNCKLTVRCPTCLLTQPNPTITDVDYCEEVVKQVVLAGMFDEEIKRKVLSTAGIDAKSLNETIAIIETEEMASRSMTPLASSQVGAASNNKQIPANDSRLQLKGKCEACKLDFLKHRVKRSAGKDDVLVTDKFCKPCWRKKNEKKREGKASQATGGEASGVAKSEEFPYLAAVQKKEGLLPDHIHELFALNEGVKSIPLPNHIFDGTRGWMQAPVEPHPVVDLTVSIDQSDYDHLRLPCPKMRPMKCSVVVDSGCQSVLLGLKMFNQFGLKKSCLVPVKGQMSAINGEGIDILGAVFLRLEGKDANNGAIVKTAVMAHVSRATDRFFISQQAMRELGIISHDFPKVQAPLMNAAAAVAEQKVAPCGCPSHSKPPDRPTTLPFEPLEENVDKMKAWLLDRFASSTFNVCPHQPLPMMKTDPIRIHVDPKAIPKPAYTAATVPIHYREEVSKQLKSDVAKGVIAPVPPGVPTTWQARMHVVPKADGSPRRTVDFRPLNMYCKRETQHVVPPYKQARTVPAGGFRTVTDCRDGYHSCPLAEEDRHLTTFITEEGRFWYCVAPQGFMASGDGYNQRYDNIIADVARKSKCVDDVIMWDNDESIADHWWRIIDYLILVGSNGIILNPKKFQFCQREVNFAGFLITQDDVKPLPKYLDGIRNFPRPTNISDVRSFFGLVNQVSHYARLTDLMAPFKPLLSPKTRFRWDDNLEQSFQLAKLEIIKSIKEGVKIFDPSTITTLSPDWSKTGIGYFLYQKYCDCPSNITTCCDNGWRITLAGSRFLHKAEKNYWPVEGEALAVAWALEDTRFFTIGCGDLHIQTDHRPLVKLFGDRTLDEIDNRRLINLKEKTMAWKFEIHHVPGRSIPAPDATSRHPQERCLEESLSAIRMVCDADEMEMCIVAGARTSLPPMQAVTWERVRDETSRDGWLLQLIDMAEDGFPDSLQLMPPQLLPYWRFRDNLSVIDGVLMFGSRVVVPPKLRDEVICHLHSAHQGVSQMTNRANACVFWPGITSDIQAARTKCGQCDVNAPSQSKMPPAEPFIPTAPFQAISTDYFKFEGKWYLLTVDRFSNWPDLREAPVHSANSGAKGLIKAYRQLFATFGVPEELSSDGGPEYTSKEFQDFLKLWGVRHRLSSAYNHQSNGRAEVTVKTMKRLLCDNVSEGGNLNTDAVTRAMLQLRNTPEGDSGLSPAQVLMGRTLRDTLPLTPPIPRNVTVFDDCSPVSRVWKDVWLAKEDALKSRLSKQTERLVDGARQLKPLSVGDSVRIQNQTGSHPTKWDKTGVVMQIGENDKYVVRVDGSRRLTLRNRRYLRKMIPSKFYSQVPQPPKPQPLANREPSKLDHQECQGEPSFDSAPVAHQAPKQPQEPTLQLPPELPVADPLPVGQLVPGDQSSPQPPTSEPVLTQVPQQIALEPHVNAEPIRRSTREKRKPDWYGDRG